MEFSPGTTWLEEILGYALLGEGGVTKWNPQEVLNYTLKKVSPSVWGFYGGFNGEFKIWTEIWKSWTCLAPTYSLFLTHPMLNWASAKNWCPTDTFPGCRFLLNLTVVPTCAAWWFEFLKDTSKPLNLFKALRLATVYTWTKKEKAIQKQYVHEGHYDTWVTTLIPFHSSLKSLENEYQHFKGLPW